MVVTVRELSFIKAVFTRLISNTVHLKNARLWISYRERERESMQRKEPIKLAWTFATSKPCTVKGMKGNRAMAGGKERIEYIDIIWHRHHSVVLCNKRNKCLNTWLHKASSSHFTRESLEWWPTYIQHCDLPVIETITNHPLSVKWHS